MILANEIERLLMKYKRDFHPVVPFDASNDRAMHIQLSDIPSLSAEVINDIDRFSNAMQEYRVSNNAKYLYGGYREKRVIYHQHHLFNQDKRDIHLGVDVWCEPGVPVYAPLGGMIHSFAYNGHPGDYGGTVVMLHQLETLSFYIVYGHLSMESLTKLSVGNYLIRGSQIGVIGDVKENGGWPPHLHIQVTADMEHREGDFPGVCHESQLEHFLGICPDPTVLLPF